MVHTLSPNENSGKLTSNFYSEDVCQDEGEYNTNFNGEGCQHLGSVCFIGIFNIRVYITDIKFFAQGAESRDYKSVMFQTTPLVITQI